MEGPPAELLRPAVCLPSVLSSGLLLPAPAGARPHRQAMLVGAVGCTSIGTAPPRRLRRQLSAHGRTRTLTRMDLHLTCSSIHFGCVRVVCEYVLCCVQACIPLCLVTTCTCACACPYACIAYRTATVGSCGIDMYSSTLRRVACASKRKPDERVRPSHRAPTSARSDVSRALVLYARTAFSPHNQTTKEERTPSRAHAHAARAAK